MLDLPPFLGEPNTLLALDSIWVSLAVSQSLRAGGRLEGGVTKQFTYLLSPHIKMLSYQKPYALLHLCC